MVRIYAGLMCFGLAGALKEGEVIKKGMIIELDATLYRTEGFYML